MPAFFDNARRDGDGRYRFRRGYSVDPHEDLHPEMGEQAVEVGADVPSTISELIAMQQARRAEAGEYPVWELEEAGNRVPGLSKVISKMVSGG